MTREEAIAILEEEAEYLYQDDEPYNREAFRIAIQALSQEPCDDAISRDMALKKMADYVASGYADSAEDFAEYSRIICQLPSVTQKSGKKDVLDKIKAIVVEWEPDTWTDDFSYECMRKIADIVAESEE